MPHLLQLNNAKEQRLRKTVPDTVFSVRVRGVSDCWSERVGTTVLRLSFCATVLAAVTVAGCAVNEEKDVAKYRSVLDANTPDSRSRPAIGCR